MSRGPGQVEQRIGELFAVTKDRAFSVADICDHAFALGGAIATRVQRLSATRAAHRLLHRAAAIRRKSIPAFDAAFEEAGRILGRRPQRRMNNNSAIFAVGARYVFVDEEYRRTMEAAPTWPVFLKASPYCNLRAKSDAKETGVFQCIIGLRQL